MDAGHASRSSRSHPRRADAGPPATLLTARLALSTAVAALALTAAASPLAAQDVDPALLVGLEAREIGPAGMSGRIAALDATEGDHGTIWVGAATGGVWKSTDRGLTWEKVFDEQPVASIGAIDIFQPAPDVVWVGTGEANVRNSTSVGNGVYRTRDGGRTWEHMGLEETERIEDIIVHPTDPNVVYVSALGHLWGENPERGVYRTTDGGETWEKVLYVDERTGASNMKMDPSNPNKIFAAMWQLRRWPYHFRSGGPGSGLYVTRDGGDSWEEVSDDPAFPEGDLGKIGIGIAHSNPDVVYALVEAENSMLLRSDDGGASWRRVNTSTNIAPRAFYYARLWVDPERPDRLYNVHGTVEVSDDGGRTFRGLTSWFYTHPDHHAFWIDPDDPEFLITGNDGGVYFSEDRGEDWDFAANIPLAQFYHIRVDDEVPYNVYGGLQDNGSWKGPSEVWENGGIRNHHWEEIAFGDGFDAAPMPDDHMRGYGMSQGGNLVRWDLRTGERKSIRPPPPEDGTELRFNWNAGFAQDPFDPATIYYGSQFVHRSPDRGDSWQIISGDLTTDDPEWQTYKESGGLTPDVTMAENYTTIIAIEPSPIEEGVLWVGTDDGRLHVTRDGGESWTSLEENVPGVPANTWIPHIHASTHDAGTAFVVFDDHRRDDWTPYVYRTTDFGASWTRIAGEGTRSATRTEPEAPGDVWGYALSIVQDPVDPDLLFLGTEFGLRVSRDGGGSWMPFTHGVPTVGVRDLAFQAAENDLVLGTHGRAAYVIDDVSPLRTLSAETMAEPLHLFEIPEAIQYEVKQTGASRFPGDEEYRGENEPYGAMITFSANHPDLLRPDEEPTRDEGGGEAAGAAAGEAEEAEAEEADGGDRGGDGPRLKVEVADASGQVVRTFERSVRQGVNRIAWNLRRDGFDRPETGQREDEPPSPFAPSGPEVLPGEYTVTLTLGDATASAPVTVLPDPRQEIPMADRRARHDAITRAGALQNAVAEAITGIYEIRSDVDRVLQRARRVSDGVEEGAGAGEPAAGAPAGGEAAAEGQESGSGPHAELVEAGRALKDSLTALEERLWVPPDTKGIVWSLDRTWSIVNRALGGLTSSRDRPAQGHLRYLEVAVAEVEEALADYNALVEGPVAEFRSRVAASGLELFPERETVRVETP